MLAMLLVSSARAQSPLGTACEFPDLGGMTPIPLAPGASPAAGAGGDIPGGRWELVELLYDAVAPVTGTAVGALELNAADASSGNGSAALNVDITSPTAETIDETGAGPYAAPGTVLDLQNDCGEQLLLGQAEYTVDDSGQDPTMTLWGSIDVTEPFPTTILIEAEFLLVEPAGPGDEVFRDRFEGP